MRVVLRICAESNRARMRQPPSLYSEGSRPRLSCKAPLAPRKGITMRMFVKFKRRKGNDKVMERADMASVLVRDLSKADKDRLLAGMELEWQAQEAFRKVRTRDEKALDDIDKLDHSLDLVEDK